MSDGFSYDGQPNPRAYVQWKGTDVCMDFHCDCGAALPFRRLLCLCCKVPSLRGGVADAHQFVPAQDRCRAGLLRAGGDT